MKMKTSKQIDKLQKIKRSADGLNSDEQQLVNRFFADDYFRYKLITIINYLMHPDISNKKNEQFINKLIFTLNLSRLRVVQQAYISLNKNDLQILLGLQLLNQIIQLAVQDTGLLLLGIQHHFQISMNYEILRNIRNDKFYYILKNSNSKFQSQDIVSIKYSVQSCVSIYERGFINLLKLNLKQNLIQSKSQQIDEEDSIIIQLPSTLYKYSSSNQCDIILGSQYTLPLDDSLIEWIVTLEVIYGGMQDVNGNHLFMVQAYILQIIKCFLIENDLEQCHAIFQKIKQILNTTLIINPEIFITVHSLLGLMQEQENIEESQNNYILALMCIHKLYGDPRGFKFIVSV